MGPSRLRIVGLVAGSVLLAPLLYYAYTEPVRRRAIRKRRRRFEQIEVDPASSTPSQEMTEGIKARFASLVVGGRYTNPTLYWREQIGAFEWLWWKLVYAPLTGRFMYDGGLPTSEEMLVASLPVETPDYALLFGGDSEFEGGKSSLSRVVVGDAMTVTWIGQSTSYVQIEGVCVLTDPVFTERTVDSFLAPRRLRPAPCTLASLRKIDVVLVSHSHFDHLHEDVIESLGNTVQWLVPLGLASFFRRLGVTRVQELDWWESTEIAVGQGAETKRITVTATPAMHWTARSPADTNASLWASFVVKGKFSSFFHAGDTGYCEVFKDIGRLYGPFDLALLPIGAYAPRWHLRPVHSSPEDAVQIHLDLRAKKSIGVHWGTWILSDEHYLQPPLDLAVAREKFAVRMCDFDTIPPGRTLVL